MECDHIS